MSIEINELREDELTDAAELAKSPKNELDVSRVIKSLSLVAREGSQVKGVAMCIEDGDGNHCLILGLAGNDADLERSLLDKALHKLGHRGISKCQIYGSSEGSDLWSAASWTPQSIADDADQSDESGSGDQVVEDAA